MTSRTSIINEGFVRSVFENSPMTPLTLSTRKSVIDRTIKEVLSNENRSFSVENRLTKPLSSLKDLGRGESLFKFALFSGNARSLSQMASQMRAESFFQPLPNGRHVGHLCAKQGEDFFNMVWKVKGATFDSFMKPDLDGKTPLDFIFSNWTDLDKTIRTRFSPFNYPERETSQEYQDIFQKKATMRAILKTLLKDLPLEGKGTHPLLYQNDLGNNYLHQLFNREDLCEIARECSCLLTFCPEIFSHSLSISNNEGKTPWQFLVRKEILSRELLKHFAERNLDVSHLFNVTETSYLHEEARLSKLYPKLNVNSFLKTLFLDRSFTKESLHRALQACVAIKKAWGLLDKEGKTPMELALESKNFYFLGDCINATTPRMTFVGEKPCEGSVPPYPELEKKEIESICRDGRHIPFFSLEELLAHTTQNLALLLAEDGNKGSLKALESFLNREDLPCEYLEQKNAGGDAPIHLLAKKYLEISRYDREMERLIRDLIKEMAHFFNKHESDSFNDLNLEDQRAIDILKKSSLPKIDAFLKQLQEIEKAAAPSPR